MTALTLGLIGNPNSGKTTLFNQLTGSRQRVGNWAGVTVERKEGAFHTVRHAVRLVDLPGTYSLTSVSAQASLDEQIACRYIASGEVDVLVKWWMRRTWSATCTSRCNCGRWASPASSR